MPLLTLCHFPIKLFVQWLTRCFISEFCSLNFMNSVQIPSSFFTLKFFSQITFTFSLGFRSFIALLIVSSCFTIFITCYIMQSSDLIVAEDANIRLNVNLLHSHIDRHQLKWDSSSNLAQSQKTCVCTRMKI